MPGALEGIRIVDLTNIILGPYGTMLLADQGADVIKVEAPEGDAVRHIGKPGKTPGMGPTYLYVNRNKRSLCLDLKDKAARAALLKVVEGADAFVHALRPQAIEGLGLGYEAIAAIKPDIVYVGAYGFSADGPYGKLPAYDDAIQARFGIADLMGRAAGDDIPRYPPTIIADKTVGLTFAWKKIPVDTMVQEAIPDGYRGRVFSVYDVAYNLSRVAAAFLAIPLLNAFGEAGAVAIVGVVFILWSPVLPRWIGRVPELTLRFYEGSRAEEDPRAVVWGGVEETVEVEQRSLEETDGVRRTRYRLRMLDGTTIEVSKVEPDGAWTLERELD
jgi:hypothetical protein